MDPSLIILFIIIYVVLYSSIFWLLIYFEKRKTIMIDEKCDGSQIVSIIIPLYRGDTEEGMRKAVDSCLKLTYPNKEIIISWNGPEAELYNKAKEYEKLGVKVIYTEEKGKAAGLNNGIKLCKGEFFCCLDGDSQITPESVDNMVGYFKDKMVGAVATSMKIDTTNNLIQKLQWMEYIFAIYLRKLMAVINCLTVVPGPGGMYRTELVRKLGGFKSGVLGEDMEIAMRLQYNGFKIENAVNAIVLTTPPEDINTLIKQRVRWYGGFCENVWFYRDMLLNPKYKVIGMFILPTSFIWIGILFYGLFRIAWDFTDGVKNIIKHIALTGINPLLWLKNWQDYFYFEPTYMTVFTIALSILAVLTILLSLKISKEKINFKHRYINYTLYVLVYSLFLGIFWLTTLSYMLFRKKIKNWIKW